MYKMERVPEPATDSPENKKAKKKWPKEVVLAPAQYFSERSFYNWSFTDASSGYMGYLIVGGIMTVLLFPLWPDFGKIAVFYLSLYTLIILVAESSPALVHLHQADRLPAGAHLRVRAVDTARHLRKRLFRADPLLPKG